MNRPTLSDFRARWPAEAMGICQADPAVAAYCNDAQERLAMDPYAPDEGWWGGWATMILSAGVINGAAYVTTPREVARLVDMAVCQQPIHIRNGFYEYLKWGSGIQPKNCRNTGCGSTFQAYDRGNVVTLFDLTGTKTVRLYPSDPRDAGLRVLLQGKDQNGKIVLTTDPKSGLSAPGEYISLAFPFVDSAYQYTDINGIQKDETYGPVQMFQVDSNGVELPLSTMEPGEPSANYRRYLINGVPSINSCCATGGIAQVTSQARLDFIPVQNETDYLLIQNVPALVEEVQAIRYSRMDSTSAAQQSQLHHKRAIDLLNGQLDLYEGKVRTAISVPIFGGNRMRRQPV